MSQVRKSISLHQVLSTLELKYKQNNPERIKEPRKDFSIPLDRRMKSQEEYLTVKKAFITMEDGSGGESDNEGPDNQSLLALECENNKGILVLMAFSDSDEDDGNSKTKEVILALLASSNLDEEKELETPEVSFYDIKSNIHNLRKAWTFIFRTH